MHACLGPSCRLITAASLHCHEMFILLRERCHHIFQTDFGNPDVHKTQVNAQPCLGHAFGRECFGATATEHGCRLITAVSLHCQLSLAPLLQSMAVVLYPQWYANLELGKNSMLEIAYRSRFPIAANLPRKIFLFDNRTQSYRVLIYSLSHWTCT